MALKSPVVQPTRQRRVLSDALYHVGLDDQNATEAVDCRCSGLLLFFSSPVFLEAQHLSRRAREMQRRRTSPVTGGRVEERGIHGREIRYVLRFRPMALEIVVLFILATVRALPMTAFATGWWRKHWRRATPNCLL